MDKFSKILVSAAAASVLASGAMASDVVFYKTGKDTNGLKASDYTAINIKDASADDFGAIKVDKLLKEYSNLSVNAYDDSTWPNKPTDSHNRMLAYYSSSELPKESTLKFTLSCGFIEKPASGDVYLYALDYNGSDYNWIKVGHVTDFATATKGSKTGYTMMKFSLDSQYEETSYGLNDHNFTTYDGGHETVNDTTGLIPAGTLLVIGSDRNVTHIERNATNAFVDASGAAVEDSNITKLNILPIKGTKCGCVCDTTITLSDAKDKTGVDLSAPMSGVTPATLITYADGLTAKVYHRENSEDTEGFATSYIDTTAGIDRKKFVDENLTGGKGDTGELASRFWVQVSNKADYGIDLGSGDTFKLNVNRAIYCAVKDVKIIDNNGDAHKLLKNTTTGAYELEGDFGDYSLTSKDNNITISVNGTDVICPGMWRVSLEITPDEQGTSSTKLLDVANAADWRIKAMQFIIPYLNTDPNYGTYIVITNMGDKAASVFFDAYGDSGKNEGQASYAYYTNIQLGDIPRRSTRIYFPKDMNNALKAKFPAWHANRYMAKFYVVADENNIEAAAFQKDGNNGKRSIPVLTVAYHNEGNFTDPEWAGHKFHE